jgi:hypothetical protein
MAWKAGYNNSRAMLKPIFPIDFAKWIPEATV